MAKGTLVVMIIIITILVIVTLLILLRSEYNRPASDFGTWSAFNTTLCLNSNQGCDVSGTSQRYRTCTPNARTGYGCIDSNGKHTFKPEIVDVDCDIVCYTSVWDNFVNEPCTVFDDLAGTTTSTNQNCRNPDQFTYSKITRECVAQDSTGTNGCVKSNGSLASIGETETVLIPCDDIDDCFQGEWGSCPPSTITVSADCGGNASECGVLLQDQFDAPCFQTINGNLVQVNSSNCFPPDDPGPCSRQCFNFPCAAYPTGYSNISDFLSDGSTNVFIRFFNQNGDYVCADWASPAQEQAAVNQQPVIGDASLPGGGQLDVAIMNSGDEMRFQIIPSQTYNTDGAFYLIAHVPFSGQQGICSWTGSNIRVVEFGLPGTLGQSLDDIPGLDLFRMIGPSGGPWNLVHWVPGAPPTETQIYCNNSNCLNADVCTQPWENINDLCM